MCGRRNAETINMETFRLDSEGHTLLSIRPGSAGFDFQLCKDLPLKPLVSKSLMSFNMKKSNKKELSNNCL